MRTTLFLSTLFAVSLVGGVALADKPFEHNRTHGDQIDKSRQHDSRPALASVEHGVANQRLANAPANTHVKNAGESRINCSADGADCAASHGKAASKASNLSSMVKQGMTGAQHSKYGQKEDGGSGADSEACAEADQCTPSSKAAKSVWASHSSGGGDPGMRNLSARPGSATRALQQKLAVPASPEDVQDTPSSDGAKKIWAKESVKHGTFTGPIDLDVSSQEHRAAARIAQQKGTPAVHGAVERLQHEQAPADKGSKDAADDR